VPRPSPTIRSRARRHRTVALAAVVASTGVSACGLPSGEQLVDGSDVAGSVQQQLQIPLAKTERVDSTAVLVNVRDVYTGQSSNETVMIVDFNTAAATVQLTSGRTAGRPEPALITRDNVVVLYRHEPGTISRLRELRTAVDHVAPPA
jgi:hypothetical protein